MDDLTDWLRKLDDADRRAKEPQAPQATMAGAADSASKAAALREPMVVWEVGDVVADIYQVTGILGEGGMGRVYKVRHKAWSVDLAVKCPKPEQLAKAGGADNFVRECETWVNLGLHPHTVSCYYVRTLGGTPRVFAEYVEGGSLADWIRSRALYDGGAHQALKRILDVSIQFAWGLHYAHEQGLVHQDVKPANVMMTPDGLTKVTDFGLARARQVESGQQNGAAGQSIMVASGGMTPAYCSPEQASGRPLSRKTDIWSLGVCILEMFSGGVSWISGRLAAEALQSRLDARAEDSGLPAMPQPVAELLKRCFATHPHDRPQTMRELAERLIATYPVLTGEPYPRTEPKPADLSADSLNNRALSHLDLGNIERAENAWQAALAADPSHAETTYNRGVRLWRQAKLTDDKLLEQLEAASAAQGHSWQTKHLLALVHLERGDVEAAIQLLGAATKQAPNELRLQESLKLARSGAIVPGRLLRSFEQDANSLAACLSADGRLVLRGEGNSLKLYDVASGKCVRTFVGHETGVRSIGLSADARIAISWCNSADDPALRIWEVATGRCLHIVRVEGAAQDISIGSASDGIGAFIGLSADGGTALVYAKHQPIKVLDVAGGRWVRSLDGIDSNVLDGCISRDGRLALVLLGMRGASKLGLWDVATGRCKGMFQRHADGMPLHKMLHVSLCAETGLALSGDADARIRVWDVATGRCVRSFEGHRGQVESISLSANGRLALSSGRDDTVRLWDVATGRCLRTFHAPRAGAHIRLSADGRVGLSALNVFQLPRPHAGLLQLSRIHESAEATAAGAKVMALVARADTAIDERRYADALEYLREARAMPGWERAPRLLAAWSRLSLFCRRTHVRASWPLTLHGAETKSVSCLCFSADARLAVSGDVRGTLQLWDLATGKALDAIRAHDSPIVQVCLSADARFALSAAGERVALWELATRTCVRTFERRGGHLITGFDDDGRGICLSADARWVAICDLLDVQLWDATSGRCVRKFAAFHFTNDGPGTQACLARLDRVLRGEERSHSECAVLLTEDARHAFCADDGDTLRIRQVSTGRCLQTVCGDEDAAVKGRGVKLTEWSPLSRAQQHWFYSLSASADERLVAFARRGNPLRIVDVATGKCLETFAEIDYIGRITSDARFIVSYDGPSKERSLRIWDIGSRRCVHIIPKIPARVSHLCVSEDARIVGTCDSEDALQLWHLDWELEARESVEWDDALRPYLDNFLRCHTPYAAPLPEAPKPTEEELEAALTRSGEPSWSEEDFERLLATLARLGHGHVRAEGVRAQLQRMARERTDSPRPEITG